MKTRLSIIAAIFILGVTALSAQNEEEELIKDQILQQTAEDREANKVQEAIGMGSWEMEQQLTKTLPSNPSQDHEAHASHSIAK